MAGAKSTVVRFTANFESSLESIAGYWAENDYPPAYDSLLDDIGARLIPNLERFPRMGRPFLSRQPETVEALALQEKLGKRLAKLAAASELREYLLDDYLVLYALVGKTAYLLSIRHHKQLSFDFARLWLERG